VEKYDASSALALDEVHDNLTRRAAPIPSRFLRAPGMGFNHGLNHLPVTARENELVPVVTLFKLLQLLKVELDCAGC